jgi:RNA polymerase sigma-70 factor (ECF subfamily)
MPDHDRNPDDRELIDRIAQKDEKSFRELFDRYQERVFNLAYRYTGSYHDAEEITQDVFLKVYKGAAKFRHGSHLNTWLYRITINTAMNFKMKKRIATESLDEITEPGALKEEPAAAGAQNPEEIYKRKKKEESIRAALDSLPSNQRAAFVLAQYEGMTYAEISKVLFVSVSAVESLIYRARQSLIVKLRPLVDRGQ